MPRIIGLRPGVTKEFHPELRPRNSSVACFSTPLARASPLLATKRWLQGGFDVALRWLVPPFQFSAFYFQLLPECGFGWLFLILHSSFSILHSLLWRQSRRSLAGSSHAVPGW